MSERKNAVVPTIVAAVAVIVVLAIVILPSFGSDADDSDTGTSKGSTSAAESPASDESWEALARRQPDDPMAMGAVDAPVVMVNYSEFQCPFCGKFARDTEPTLIKEYVENGTLRIEWRDFPYLGPESTTAAHAGRAAAAQGKFWEFHDVMYADQFPPNSGRLDEDYLAGIAEDLGLDVERFRADMNSKATQAAVQNDFAEGQAIGVTGTPAFIINGVPVIGAQPTQVFRDVIDQAAAEAGQ